MLGRLIERLPHHLQPWCRDLQTHYRMLGHKVDRRQLGSADSSADWKNHIGSLVTIDGIRLRIDPSLSPKMINKIVRGTHTVQERKLILDALDPDDIVMELGGGIGMVSIACAQRIGSDRVFSYEANPFLEPLIRQNYRLNGVSPTINMCMLGPSAGEAVLNVARDFGASSIHRRSNVDRAITVAVRPFNDEVRRIGPTFLIVDIEGGEQQLADYADLSTVQKLLVELHPNLIGAHGTNSVRKKIRARGFSEVRTKGWCFFYAR